MKRKQKLWIWIITVLILCAVAFIWANSIDSQAESSAKSSAVKELIEPFLEIFVGKGNVTEHLVRKLAHFTEYTILGTFLALWLLAKRVWKWSGVLLGLLMGFTVASIDETIQIFIGRGPMVKDVLLDFSGVCFGIGVVWLVVLITEGIRKND